MSKEIKLFEKEEFGKVRVVMQGADPWFVGRDVASALGYQNTVDAINTHCRKANDYRDSEMLPTATPMKIIPESDVYRLVMRSNLPRAVEFQDWICEEVLPSIRKTGSYGTGQKTALPFAISTPLADRLAAAMTVFSAAGLEKNQLALAADKFFRHETGVSALGICGVVLVNPQQKQLLTPTELGKLLDGTSAKNINIQLALEGLQWRTPNGSWEPTEEGRAAGGTLLDTGKKHSDGTPVCQLKWPESVTDRLRKYLRDDC